MQSGSSSGRDDPFVQLLSTYMNNKAANPRLSAAKAQVKMGGRLSGIVLV